MWAVSLPPICFWHARKDIIHAWIVHLWIVNRWIVYRELAQPILSERSIGKAQLGNNDPLKLVRKMFSMYFTYYRCHFLSMFLLFERYFCFFGQLFNISYNYLFIWQFENLKTNWMILRQTVFLLWSLFKTTSNECFTRNSKTKLFPYIAQEEQVQ